MTAELGQVQYYQSRWRLQEMVSSLLQIIKAGTEPQCPGLVTLYLFQTVKRNYNVRKVKQEKSVNQTEYIQINTGGEEEEGEI